MKTPPEQFEIIKDLADDYAIKAYEEGIAEFDDSVDVRHRAALDTTEARNKLLDSVRLKISDFIRVTLNWDKASEYVEANCRDEIEKVRDSLKRMMKGRSNFMTVSYLSTHYFDRVGRFTDIYEDASEGRTIIAGKAMVKAMITLAAHRELYGLKVATDALDKWKKGDHDT